MSKSRSSHSESKEGDLVYKNVKILLSSNQQVSPMSGSTASTESKKNSSTNCLNSENDDQLKVSSDTNDISNDIYRDQTLSSTSSEHPVSFSKRVRFDQFQVEKNISSGSNEKPRLCTPPEKQLFQRSSIIKNQTNTSKNSNVSKQDKSDSSHVPSSHLFSIKKKKSKGHSEDHSKNNCVIF